VEACDGLLGLELLLGLLVLLFFISDAGQMHDARL
jgi:hypothetical protein